MQTRSSATAANNGGGQRVLGKRHAPDDSNFDFDRFNKRLNLLSIGATEPNGNSKYFIPVSNKPAVATPQRSSHAVQSKSSPHQDDHMHLDDTRDRVYVHNLDEELADIESEEERLIFLPDIEKRLSRIPQQVLTGRLDDASENQELVLYSVPKSLTVDEGHDSVRKAIVETRQRAREKAAEEARHEDMLRKYDHSDHASATETAHGYSAGYADPPDLDAMDVG